VDATTRFRPWNCCGGTGVDSIETCANLGRPRRLSVGVYFAVETLNQLARECGSLFVRKSKSFYQELLGVHTETLARQLLEFSLSFKTTPQRMKAILRETIQKSPDTMRQCEKYASVNGFSNIDYLLEQMICPDEAFRAVVIIDELEDELERILRSSLKFPVEILTIERFKAEDGTTLYKFDPFLYDLSIQSNTVAADAGNTPAVDPSDLDTIVVPAREEGFRDVFMGENMWRAIRIHPSMLPKIRHIAAYQVQPHSAITHIADVDRIEPWKDTGKYAV
jgi:hypothetical protein